MPFVQISLLEGKTPEYLKAISEGIHEALIHAFNIPINDQFQLFHEYKKQHFIVDRTFMDMARSDDTIIIYITLKTGRTITMKEQFYQRVTANLEKNPKIRKEDVMIILVDNALENWSFGQGVAQFISL